MRRWLKRIGLTLAVLAAVGLLTAAVVAWRATRVPDWYALARDQTPPDVDADAVVHRRLLPVQNWLARVSAGDAAALPGADTAYTLELTADEINALIARYRDGVHGPAEVFRVRLTPGAIDVAFQWAEQDRTVTVTAAVADAAGRPTVALGGVRVGNQSVPASLVSRLTAGRVRTALARPPADERPRIDATGGAPASTVERYYRRLLLDVLDGRAVSPEAFLPVRLEGNKFVATRVHALDVTDGRIRVTFRLLTPAEREAVVRDLASP